MSIFSRKWPALLAILVLATVSCSDTTRPVEPLVPGPPAKIVPVTGDGQVVVAGTPSIPLSALAIDTNGTPVPDVTVTFYLWYSSGMSFHIRTVRTGPDGIAHLDGWSVPGQAGTYTVYAQANGAISYAFVVKSVAGPPSRLSLWVSPSRSFTGAPLTASLEVYDAGANRLVGVVAAFSADGGASVADAQKATNAYEEGVSTKWTLGSALGTYTLRATVGSLSATATAEAVSGPPAAIARVSGDTQTVTVGGHIRAPLKVLVTDAAGRAVPAAAVRWTADAGTYSGCGTTTTDTLGTTTCIGWSLPQVGAFGLTTDAGAFSTRFTARALTAPASLVFLTVPDSMTEVRTDVEIPGDVVVEVRMPDGTPAVGYPVSFSAGNGSVSSPVAVTDSGGHASTRWRTDLSPGRTTLTATLDGTKTIGTPVRTFGPPTFLRGGFGYFDGISPGRSHTCGASRDYSILCWGSNSFGQAGGPVSGPDRLLPARLAAWSGAGASKFWSLGDHSCSSQTLDYGRSGTETRLACWGLGPDGVQAYVVPTSMPLTAYQLPALQETSLNGAMASRTDGALHACAVSSVYTIFCLGRNDHGQLGDGTATDRTVPVPVAGAATEWSTPVVLGESHSCARARSGATYCWGRNDAGQVGDGTTVDRSIPVAVAGGITFASLTAGVAHTCGLTASGTAYCWGSNASGQLGTGTIGGSASAPQAVATSRTFTSLKAGDHHTCGVVDTGLAYCWGRNDHGQLGDGTTTDRGTPGPLGDYHPPR